MLSILLCRAAGLSKEHLQPPGREAATIFFLGYTPSTDFMTFRHHGEAAACRLLPQV